MLRIADYPVTFEPGTPQLPVVSTMVSIPWGMNAQITSVKAAIPKAMKGYRILPCPNPKSEEGFAFNETIYAQDAPYPGRMAELSPPSGLRDRWVVRIHIYPVQYNPQRGELQIVDSVDVSLRYVVDEKLADTPRKPSGPVPVSFQYLYDHHIVNADLMEQQGASTQSGSYLNLLVITPSAFQSAVMPLINYHLNNNPLFRYVLVTLESIGGPDPQAIRNTIQYYYLNYNLYDVLLVGDHEQLPAFRINVPYPHPFCNGDYYYAALDGPTWQVFYYSDPWDYGDQHRDVKIGRLSGQSPTEITNLVDKILDYRQNPPSGEWPSQHLFVASRNNGGQWYNYKATKDAIIAASGSWKSSPSFYPVYGDYTSGTNWWVKYRINTSHVGTINYRGHGGPTGWDSWSYYGESFTGNDVNGLFNGDYTPAVFNVGCQMGSSLGRHAWLRHG